MKKILKYFLSEAQVGKLLDVMKDQSTEWVSYVVMVLLAAVVASYGLLTNSTAVIIGAMLISPIMGPILKISFSINTGDRKMMFRAFATLALGIVLALFVSGLAALLFPQADFTNEILARTKPTIADLIIAIASGAAGAFAMATSSGLTAFAGVAIATALMPPLCVVGIGLALKDYSVASGGFLLFLSNMIGINLAAATVFRILGVSVPGISSDTDGAELVILKKKRRNRFIISILSTIIIILPLGLISIVTVVQQEIDYSIKNSLESYFKEYYEENYTKLVSYEYKGSGDKIIVEAVVRSDTFFTSTDIVRMQELLEKKLGKDVLVTLELIYTLSIDQDTNLKSQ